MTGAEESGPAAQKGKSESRKTYGEAAKINVDCK